MTRTMPCFSGFAAVSALALVAAAGAGCYAGVEEGPPPAYVSSAEPVYYEGHPAYWWHDHWYYRNGNGWGYYHSEPSYLHEHRVRATVHVGEPRHEETIRR